MEDILSLICRRSRIVIIVSGTCQTGQRGIQQVQGIHPAAWPLTFREIFLIQIKTAYIGICLQPDAVVPFCYLDGGLLGKLQIHIRAVDRRAAVIQFIEQLLRIIKEQIKRVRSRHNIAIVAHLHGDGDRICRVAVTHKVHGSTFTFGSVVPVCPILQESRRGSSFQNNRIDACGNHMVERCSVCLVCLEGRNALLNGRTDDMSLCNAGGQLLISDSSVLKGVAQIVGAALIHGFYAKDGDKRTVTILYGIKESARIRNQRRTDFVKISVDVSDAAILCRIVDQLIAAADRLGECHGDGDLLSGIEINTFWP